MVIRTVTPAGFLVAVCILLTFSLPTFADDRCAEWAAQLESAEGRVEWQSPQSTQWQGASSGFQFCYGDRVRVVQERAVLRLANDTLVRLQENSLVNLLPEEKGFWFELLEGAGHFLSRTPKQFTIKAPYLNAAVDGTEFVVNAQPQENRVAVMEGEVRVSNDLGEVRLSEGTQTTATATTAPSPVQSIRLRDAAEWILYYPPLVVQVNAPVAIETLIQQENYGAALAELTANDLTPETTALAASLAFNTGNIAQGEQLLSRALNTSPARVEAQALQALRTLIGGDNEGALAQTTQLTQSHPQNPSALLAHAYAQQSYGKIEEALQTNLKAQALLPDNVFVLARTAELQLSVGNTRAAQKLITQALKQAPQHSRLNTLAGFIALNRFATGKAQNYFQTAIQTNSNEPLARLGLALALIQKGKIEHGRAQMEMAVLLDPGSSLLRSYLGKTYAAQNQNDWADTQYQLAKNLDPNDPTPWFYEAHLKHEENKPGEALRLITTAIEKNDNRAVYRSRMLLDSDAAARSANLAGIYNTLGFTETAKNTAILSASENPTDFSSHLSLIAAFSDDPKAKILRAKESTIAALLSPIGAREPNIGVAETGLQTYPWVSPGRSSLNEFSSLFTKRGINGNFSSLLGTQGSKGYDWKTQLIGNRISISGGKYDYLSDGVRANNDLQVQLNEGNLNYQISDTAKVLIKYLATDHSSGDLSNNPLSHLFKPESRREFSTENYLAGITGRPSANTTIILSAGKIKNTSDSTERFSTQPIYANAATESESDHSDATIFWDIDEFTYQLGFYTQQYDGNSETNLEFVVPSLPPRIVGSITTPEESDYSIAYTSISSPIHLPVKATIAISLTDTEISKQGFQDNGDDFNYRLGALWQITPNTAINMATWNINTNRLPSQPSREKTEFYYISTIEDITNFSEQTASAVKILINRNRTNVTLEGRHGEITEKAIHVTNNSTYLIHDKIKHNNIYLNIDHQVTDNAYLASRTESDSSKLLSEANTNRATSIDTYSSTVKLTLSHLGSIRIIGEGTYINQKLIQSQTPTNANHPPKMSGFITNLALELNTTKANISFKGGIYNVFDEKLGIQHTTLNIQSETMSPSQPIWPTERTIIFQATYRI